MVVSMDVKELMEQVAWRVVQMYDHYELHDLGGDEYGLFCETLWLLEEEPKTVLDWMID